MIVFRYPRQLAALGLMLPVVLGAGSNALAADPSTAECLAANEAATKLQTDKKLRKARELSAVCAAEACPVEVHDACRQRVADLNKAIPTIAFQAKDARGADVTDVRVSVDGQPLVQRLEGKAISVDPGTHTFRLEATGQAPVDKTLVVVEGQRDRVEAIAFGPPAAPTPASVATTTVTPESEAATGGGWSTQRYLALGVAGLGLIGIVIGSVEGASASSSWNNAQSECGTPTPCLQHDQAVRDYNSAQSAANASTVAFVAGGALLVGGLAWFFLAPSGGASGPGETGTLRVAPSLGASGGGMLVKGAF